MSKDIGLSLMAGLASALAFLSVLSGGDHGVFLAYLMPLPIVMIGLGLGLGRGAIGGGVALAIVAVVTPRAVPVFAAIVLAPAAVVTFLALGRTVTKNGTTLWREPGAILAWLTVAAVGLVSLGVLLVTLTVGSVEEVVRPYAAQFLNDALQGWPDDIKASVSVVWSALFPAMAGSAGLIMAIANGVLGQWAVNKAGHARRPSPSYRSLALPGWTLAALALAMLVGGAMGGEIGYFGRNIAIVLLWPYVFLGLTVVHETLDGRPYASILLGLFYVVFFVVFAWAQLAVAGLGLVRHWTRLRRERIARSQEDK